MMSEVEEVQEQMKADMEAIKDQMAAMMEAMLSMKKIMESNAAAVSTTSATAEMDPTHPSSINQMNHPVPNMVGQGGEALRSIGGPHVVQSKNSFPLYGLPPNYAPPNVVHVSDENTDHFALVLFESQQPQLGHAHFAQPMRGHVRNPEIMLWSNSNLTLDIPLRGLHLVACPSLTPRGALSIARCNPYISLWEDCHLPWKKERNLIL